MDPVSALKSEFFRPLVTILIPGLFATSPFSLIAVHRFESLKTYMSSPLGAGVLILFAGTLAGMLMEDIGSRIENLLWILVKSDERDHEWKMYLRLKMKDEYVGQRYLDSVHVRMKFELAMIPATIVFIIGANYCNHRCGSVTGIHMWCLSTTLVIVCGYLICEVVQSSITLCEARKEILIGYEAERIARSSASMKSDPKLDIDE